jgi:acyl-CoA thioesterase I
VSTNFRTPLAMFLVVTALLSPVSFAQADAAPFSVTGESLVLDKLQPANFQFTQVIPGSVTVRSAYKPDTDGAVVFNSGSDYEIDFDAGTIRRLEGSRIPDFSTNVLYGQHKFDHRKFPGMGNAPFFVFVDYQTHSGSPLCVPKDQSALLRHTKAKLRDDGPFKLVVFGDSISAGGEASTLDLRFQRRYGAYLQRRFPKADITVENGATGGDTTRQGLKRVEEKVLTRDPDLVLIGFGMNDNNIGSVPVDEFRANLLTLIRQIREQTHAEIILFSAFPPNPEWKYGSSRMAEYAAATEQAAEEASCAYADVYSAWTKALERKDPSSLLGNNINHPNDFGHSIYLEALKCVSF